jgi:cytoskeletal protein CcmA (bactofilin family)
MLFRQQQSSADYAPRRNARGSTPSLLSVDVKVDGDVIADGDIYIGGAVKGRIVAQKLTVGEGAMVSGIIEVETAIIAGTVTGKLTAETVTIKRTANVSADITHVHLSIEPGGTFDGYSRHVTSIQLPSMESESDHLTLRDPLTALTHVAESPA